VRGLKFYKTHVLGEEKKRGKERQLAEFLILHIAPYVITDLPSLSKQSEGKKCINKTRSKET
jgi:hypothetical protein